MAAKVQVAKDFRVIYSRRIHSDGRGREHSEVEMSDDEDQHPDVELQDAGKYQTFQKGRSFKVLTFQSSQVYKKEVKCCVGLTA